MIKPTKKIHIINKSLTKVFWLYETLIFYVGCHFSMQVKIHNYFIRIYKTYASLQFYSFFCSNFYMPVFGKQFFRSYIYIYVNIYKYGMRVSIVGYIYNIYIKFFRVRDLSLPPQRNFWLYAMGDYSRQRCCGARNFRRRKFRRRNFRQTEFSPNWIFAERKFRRTEISPNGNFAVRIFAERNFRRKVP